MLLFVSFAPLALIQGETRTPGVEIETTSAVAQHSEEIAHNPTHHTR